MAQTERQRFLHAKRNSLTDHLAATSPGGGINVKTGFGCKSVISLRWNRHSIVHMSLKPARDELCNFQTILFQHHHMTGAVYAVVFEAYVLVGDAGLGKVLRRAVVPRSVKRCFAADD